MEPTILQITWFLLFGVLIAGYAVLDGFDLGAGIASLFTKNPDHRRAVITAIAPVWDGNEVWLITGGGALFAAFPPVYATVFSGFYLAMMLLLVGLIARAVALEFHGKLDSEPWRRVMQRVFGVASLLVALLLGVALGNIAQGLPLTEDGLYTGGLLGLLRPYPLAFGVLTVLVFAGHGALYVRTKSTGDLARFCAAFARRVWTAATAVFAAVTAWTLAANDRVIHALTSSPWTAVAAAACIAALAATWVALIRQRPGAAFAASSAFVAACVAQVGAGLYPALVPDPVHPERSLTIATSSSSPGTLQAMLIIALIGMPLVVAYTIVIHRIFRGPVNTDSFDY